MKGLADKVNLIFEQVSQLECVRDYTLIGGTALSLQINKRLSEDLDFCQWSQNLRSDKPVVNWPAIEKELESVGEISSRDVLGFDHVNFVLDGVNISFFTKQENLSPVKDFGFFHHLIRAAGIDAIGAMKIELILRRSEFKDYYDLYSILREGRSLKALVAAASAYSNHRLKSRDALSFLANGSNYKKTRNFSLLLPFYNIDHKGIERYMREVIKREFEPRGNE